ERRRAPCSRHFRARRSRHRMPVPVARATSARAATKEEARKPLRVVSDQPAPRLPPPELLPPAPLRDCAWLPLPTCDSRSLRLSGVRRPWFSWVAGASPALLVASATLPEPCAALPAF